VDNTHTNREKLIEEVIETWTEEEVYKYAKQQLYKEYKEFPDLFEEDWESVFPSEEDE
tara:strand:- start:961 stop:1134 length:174 start_codon:yes stop_codon:yes gene_type:complete